MFGILMILMIQYILLVVLIFMDSIELKKKDKVIQSKRILLINFIPFGFIAVFILYVIDYAKKLDKL